MLGQKSFALPDGLKPKELVYSAGARNKIKRRLMGNPILKLGFYEFI